MQVPETRGVRIDKWLWFVRFYKSRGLAAKAINGGHVRLNGARAKPASPVRPGDVIDVVRNQLKWRVTVAELPVRRGSAPAAQRCYTEDAATRDQRRQFIEGRKLDRMQMPRTEGRPDKHTRRKLMERKR